MRQAYSTFLGGESGAWSKRMGRALRSTGRGPRQSQHRGWGLDLDRLQVRGLKSGPSRRLEGLRHQSLLVIRLEVPPSRFRFGCFLVKWALASPQEEWVPAERAALSGSPHQGPAPAWARLEPSVFHRPVRLFSDSCGFTVNLEVRSCESSIFLCLIRDGFRQPRFFTYLYKT